ncbi:hypothetical protein BDR03DRAFT_1019766 [Suillus americanus]|nr:hypothetical protein BDR03DRAFT_1019766 [Suillus americanus]
MGVTIIFIIFIFDDPIGELTTFFHIQNLHLHMSLLSTLPVSVLPVLCKCKSRSISPKKSLLIAALVPQKGSTKDEVIEAISPGGHIIKRRARSRPVSIELLESVNHTPSPKAEGSKGTPSPRSQKGKEGLLPSKYKPHNSGIVLSDDESIARTKFGVKHEFELYLLRGDSLRLREEVDILAQLSAWGAHPNVLTYVDSWEQDDALFIRTELCELGNFGRFLWKYGRARGYSITRGGLGIGIQQ